MMSAYYVMIRSWVTSSAPFAYKNTVKTSRVNPLVAIENFTLNKIVSRVFQKLTDLDKEMVYTLKIVMARRKRGQVNVFTK